MLHERNHRERSVNPSDVPMPRWKMWQREMGSTIVVRGLERLDAVLDESIAQSVAGLSGIRDRLLARFERSSAAARAGEEAQVEVPESSMRYLWRKQGDSPWGAAALTWSSRRAR
jgi:hypothetical protein